MPLFDAARRNVKAEPLHSFGIAAGDVDAGRDIHAQKVATAAAQTDSHTAPETRQWQEEMRQLRSRRDAKLRASAAAAAEKTPAADGGLVDHRLAEELVDMVGERKTAGRERLARAAAEAEADAKALAARCATISPTMAAAVRPGAADAVRSRWQESRASSSSYRLRPGESDGARRRLRLLVQEAKPAVDTGATVVTDSLLLLLHAVPRRGGGGGGAIRVLRRRPTLQVLSFRSRQRKAADAQRKDQAVLDVQKGATRALALAGAPPAVDARLGSAIQRRRDENTERAAVRQRGGRTHEVERRRFDPDGRAPFARTHSALIAQMAYHRRAVRGAKPSVDNKGRNLKLGHGRGAAAVRPRWRPTLAPEGKLARGGGFWPSESGVMVAVQAHRRRLRAIQERKVRVQADVDDAAKRKAAAKAGTGAEKLQKQKAVAARQAWQGNRMKGPGHEPLPPDPAGDVYRLHEKRVKIARQRGGKLSHGWGANGGDAYAAGKNLEKQRRQRVETRLKKEREVQVDREKLKAAERRTRRPPPKDPGDLFYWSQLSD